MSKTKIKKHNPINKIIFITAVICLFLSSVSQVNLLAVVDSVETGISSVVGPGETVSSATTSSATPSCSSGFTLSGSKCVAPAQYSCDTGTLSGSECVATPTPKTEYSCNGSDTLSGSNCNTVATRYFAIFNGNTPTDCPSGYTPYSNTLCGKSAVFVADSVVPNSSTPTSKSATPVSNSSVFIQSSTPASSVEIPKSSSKSVVAPSSSAPKNSISSTAVVSVSSKSLAVSSSSSVSSSQKSSSSSLTSSSMSEVYVKASFDTSVIAKITPNTEIRQLTQDKLTQNKTIDSSQVKFYKTNPENKLDSSYKIFGFGQESQPLAFSKPIEISYNLSDSMVSKFSTGQGLVMVKHYGDADFGAKGITADKEATCSDIGDIQSGVKSTSLNINGKKAVFYTCSASSFYIGTKEDFDSQVAPTQNQSKSSDSSIAPAINPESFASENKPTDNIAAKSNWLSGFNLVMVVFGAVLLILVGVVVALWKNLFGTKKSNKSLNSVYTKSNGAKSTPSKVVPTIINIPQSKDNIKIESDTKSNIHDYDISHLQKPKLTDYDKAMVEQEIEILDDDFSNLPSSNTVESDIDVDIATESVIDALSEDISFEEFVKNPPAESNISASKPHFIVDPNDQIAIVKGETVHDTNIPIVSNIGEDGKLHLKTNPNNQLYSSKSNKKKNTNKKNI